MRGSADVPDDSTTSSNSSHVSGESSPGRSRQSSVALPNWTNPALYKTRMCDHYRLRGECKFGRKCWFAHGRQEIRQVPRLDLHPEAEVDALVQVIESLPPSRSRDVAMNKGQQLTQQMLISELLTHRRYSHPADDAVFTPSQPSYQTSALSPQHQAQIEPLLEQLHLLQVQQQQPCDLDGDDSSPKYRSTSTDRSSPQSAGGNPTPPPVVPLKSNSRSDDAELEPARAPLKTMNDEDTPKRKEGKPEKGKKCKRAEMMKNKLVDVATNTEPHACFSYHPLDYRTVPTPQPNPDDYRCYIEYGGVPVHYDVLTYGFAYPT